jgi:TonB family protein
MMRLNLVLPLVALGLVTNCWSQDSQKTKAPAECAKLIRVKGSLPTGQFKFLPGETYKRMPVVQFVVREDGTVSDVKLVQGPGVSQLDAKVLDSIALWKFKPRPSGCGVIESKMSVNAHPDRFSDEPASHSH